MQEYERYQLALIFEKQYQEQLAAAREGADRRYPGSPERTERYGTGNSEWPEEYSFFETASWPAEFSRDRVSRDVLRTILSRLSGPQDLDAFFGSSYGGIDRNPLQDGYEADRNNTTTPLSFVYWRIQRSGFVYQRRMNDQEHLFAAHLIDYITRAVDSLVRCYTFMSTNMSALHARFRVTETGRKCLCLPWTSESSPKCNLPEIAYELVHPGSEWRAEKREDLVAEVVRDLMQQCGLADPPQEEVTAAIATSIGKYDQTFGAVGES